MEVLRIILSIVFIIDCVAMLVVVLMQEGKGNGLGSIAGANESTYWGKNKGRTVEGTLPTVTKVLATLFFVLALVLNLNF